MPPPDRASRYRQWMARAGLAFAAPTLAALAVLGRVDALWRVPAEFDPVRALLPRLAAGEVALGALAGVALGMVVSGWRARRGGRPVGRIGALMPRSRVELPWGAGVALVAGVTEEAFFRLLLPLLVAICTGSALAGFVVGGLLFGAMHRYQGWRGVLGTTLLGAAMAGLYLASGALWVAVLLHVAVDLNALVVWPAMYRGDRGASFTRSC